MEGLEAHKTRPTKLYCTCRMPYDEARDMIQCDRCAEWFHFDCIQLDPSAVDDSRTYFCPSCVDDDAPTRASKDEDVEHAKSASIDIAHVARVSMKPQSLPAAILLAAPILQHAHVGTPPDSLRPRSSRKRTKVVDDDFIRGSPPLEDDDAYLHMRNLALSPAVSQSSRSRRPKSHSFSSSKADRYGLHTCIVHCRYD